MNAHDIAAAVRADFRYEGEGGHYTQEQVDEMEGLADDLRERMVRVPGKDRSRLHLTLSMMVGDTLGPAASSVDDLKQGMQQLVTVAYKRGAIPLMIKELGLV